MDKTNGFLRADRIPAAAILAPGLVLCLLLAWLPLAVSLSHFGFEDVFYYLGVARNLARGAGPTLDGIHPTNGFHLLWMLISIGLVSMFPAASPTPVHLLFSLCAILHVLTALLVYRLVLRAGSRPVALAALALWLFNYGVIEIALCGLETALFGFLLVSTLSVYVPARECMRVRGGLVVGALLGLTALARLDGALFGIVIAADQGYLWVRARERTSRLTARIVPMTSAAVLAIVPWLIWSVRVSGTIFPNSHRALKLWIGRETTGEGALLGHWLNMLVRYLPDMARIYGITPLWPLSIALLAALFIVLLRTPRMKRPSFPALLFILYPLAHLSYYAAGFAPLNRYLYPAHGVAYIGIMAAAAGLLKGRSNERAVRLLAAAAFVLLFLNTGLAGVRSWQQGRGSAGTHSLHWTMYTQAAPWLQENIPPGEKIGSFNSGIYSYFSGRTVVNLDGVINDSVIPALENRRLFSYLQEEGIRYVIDWEGMLDFAFTRYGGLDDYRSHFSVLKTFEQPWGPYAGQRLLVLKLKEHD